MKLVGALFSLRPPFGTTGSSPVVIHYDVLEAIQAYFKTRGDLQAATSDGKFWELEAKEKTQFPYAEYMLVSQPTETYTTGNYTVDRATVQFSLHDATSQGSKDLARRFKAAYTKAPLAVQGVPVMHCLPGPLTTAKGEGKGPRGEDSFLTMIDWDILMSLPIPCLYR